MAKKSAYSKGFRKTVKAKPFLTKKEITALIVIVAVILLGILLFNLFYDDGYLGAEEIQATDIVSYASTDLRDRYIKLGTVNELEGFTLEQNDPTADGVSLRHSFTPNEPVENIDSVVVSGSFVNAPMLAANNYGYTSSLASQGNIVMTDIQETTVLGYPAYVYSYKLDYYVEDTTAEAAAEETAEKTGLQCIRPGHQHLHRAG